MINGLGGFVLWLVGMFAIVILVILISHAIGRRLIAWSEEIPADIVIEALRHLDHPTSEVHRENNLFLSHHYASLRVTNRERYEVTDCYAVLRRARIVVEEMHIPVMEVGYRLPWKDQQGNTNHQISIAPRNGEAILRVYHVGWSIGEKETKIIASDFMASDGLNEIFNTTPKLKYELRIDFYGKIKGNDIRIKPFIGYLDIEGKNDDGKVCYDVSIYEGQPKK